ncbi:hypothetical protein EON65_07410 [archaeon]|nr:MAG: hypothetical protein EON65_07410 [archaeon]
MWKKGARIQGKKNSWVWLIVGIVATTFLLLAFLNHQVAHNENSRAQSAAEYNDKLQKLTLSRQSNPEAPMPMIRKKLAQQPSLATIEPVVLPHFGMENREYVFSSIIERSSLHSLELYATTFMLGHAFLRLPDIKARFVDPKYKDIWLKTGQQFLRTKYLPSGRRDYPKGERYTCHIRHTDSSESYTVVGDFVPNRGSVSNGANRRVDILRCPIAVSDVTTLFGYIHGDEKLYLELYQGAQPVISFYIPWKARMVGFGLDSVDAADRTSPWEGLAVEQGGNQSVALASTSIPIKTHLCMPCMKKAISRNNLPLILEYIAHHLNIGFDHVSLAYAFSFKSSHMNHLLFILRDYIHESKVSIRSLTSSADDEKASLFMLEGMQFFRVFMASLQSTLCLYRSKGVYDYMMVLDNDEMLIPQFKLDPPTATLRNLLARNFHSGLSTAQKVDLLSEKLSKGKWKPSVGWADGHRHPACFLSIKPQLFLQSPQSLKRAAGSSPSWLGEEFKHGPELNSTREYITMRETALSTIVDVQNIYFMGNKYPGACVVDWYWNGCNDQKISICLEPQGVSDSTATLSDMVHTFDEKVTNMDGRFTEDAIIYHYRYYEIGAAASPAAMKETNLYRSVWYEDAKKQLLDRGFEVLLTLPLADLEPPKAIRGQKLIEASDYEAWRGTDDLETEESNESAMVMESLSTSLSDVVTLPRFSSDLTELVMSSIIERTAETNDLTITIFMLCHYIVRLQENLNQQVIMRIHPMAVSTWNKAIANFLKTQYRLPGKRVPEDNFACRIRNVMHLEGGGCKTLDGPLYVKGRMVPSSATVDHNANYRAEILRCLLPSEESARYVQYAGNKSVSVEVELIKNNKALIKFQVPYESRITGYMSFSTNSVAEWQNIDEDYEEKPGAIEMSNQGDAISSISSIGMLHNKQHKEETQSLHDHLLGQHIYAMPSLTISPWKGRDEKMDKVYMCVPGWRTSPSREFLGHLLEFIQHHLSIGIQHIFLGVTFAWKSPHMRRLLRVLKPFMDEGKLSIASHTADNLDYRFTLAGTVIRNTPIKVYSVNLCLYYAKGMADYIAIWDVDEFFVLNNPKYKTVVDLIEDVDSIEVPSNPYIGKSLAVINATYKTSKGMADNHAHPLCYIQLYSSTLYQVDHHINDPRHESIWFRDNFMHSALETDELSHKKGIHPTRRSFSLNLHTGGACALPLEYTDCSVNAPNMKLILHEDHGGQQHCYGGLRALRKDMQRTHNFDEPPQLLDAKNVDRSDAEIYHVQFFRRSRVVSNESMLENHHDASHKYASDYSAKVLADLDARDLYQPLTFLNDDSFVLNTLRTVPTAFPVATANSKVVDVPAIVLLASTVVASKQKIVSYFVSNMSSLAVSKHNFAEATLPKIIVATTHLDKVQSSAAQSATITSNCKLTEVVVVKCHVKTSGSVVDMLGQLEVVDEQGGLLAVTCSSLGNFSGQSGDIDVTIDLQSTACSENVDFHVSFRLDMNISHPYNEDIKSPGMFSVVTHKPASNDAMTSDGSELLSTIVDFQPNRFSVAMVSEYLVHHYLLGVKHVTLPVKATYSSSSMYMWTKIFRHFIAAGKLTVVAVLHDDYTVQNSALAYQVVRALTIAHAEQRSSKQLLQWGFNYFYIPRTFPNPYPVFSSAPLFNVGDTDIEVLTLSADEYAENSLVSQTMQYRLYQGEIYVSTPKSSDTLKQVISQLEQTDGNKQVEGSSQVHSGGVLYEVWAVDMSRLNCVRMATAALESQQQRFCVHQKSQHAGSSQPEYLEKEDSNVTATYNTYHSEYFSTVYRHMVQENLDLYIDSIEVISAEMIPTYKVGDAGFMLYRKVYEQNPLVDKKPPMIRMGNSSAEAPKKSKLAGITTVSYNQMRAAAQGKASVKVGGF